MSRILNRMLEGMNRQGLIELGVDPDKPDEVLAFYADCEALAAAYDD
jgi:hypothetical protein